MKPIETILVCVDYSEPSKAALREAARLANARSARLVCLHVIDREVIKIFEDSPDFDKENMMDMTYQGLTGFIREVIGDAHNLHAEVCIGNPYQEVIRVVHSENPTLLILGENGYTSGRANRVGVLATKCVRRAPVEVMLVKRGQELPFRSIVACVDFSENSVRAARKACEIAKMDGAHVHLVHVYRSNLFGVGQFGSFQLPEFPEQEIISQHQMKLTELTISLAKDFPEVEISSILHSYMSASHGIKEELEKVNADLAVLGTNGASGITGMLLGTTAERLLHDSPCSVLTVKPEGFKERL